MWIVRHGNISQAYFREKPWCFINWKFHSCSPLEFSFIFKFIQLVTIPDLFPLKFVQKCQHCKVCVLRENSKAHFVWPEEKLTKRNHLEQVKYLHHDLNALSLSHPNILPCWGKLWELDLQHRTCVINIPIIISVLWWQNWLHTHKEYLWPLPYLYPCKL